MNNKTVLVCEDDEGIIDIAQIVLGDKGYTVVGLLNPAGIFATIAETKPDLILLDLWMLGLSGDDITRHLKAAEATRHIPVIIMSANKDAEEIARQAGAEDFLAKPFDLSALEKIVEKYV